VQGVCDRISWLRKEKRNTEKQVAPTDISQAMRKIFKALYACALGHEHFKRISGELGKLKIELQ